MKKAKMKHKAKRPFKLDFSSQGETHKELFTLELDANDIYEWKVGDSVPEIGHSIMQLEFYGLDFATGGESLLGTVLFDSCDWGLEIHKVVSNAWYEATHPWLDWKNFKDQEIKDTIAVRVLDDKGQEWQAEWWYSNDDTYELDLDRRYLKSNGYAYSPTLVAVKPLKPFEYAYFENVEVWQK